VGLESLVKLFRYAEEKTLIEDALKLRRQSLNSSLFKVQQNSPILVSGRTGRGRGLASGKSMQMGGGRGFAGNTRSTSLSVVPNSKTLVSLLEQELVEEKDNRAVDDASSHTSS
jgi:hypothetical protein